MGKKFSFITICLLAVASVAFVVFSQSIRNIVEPVGISLGEVASLYFNVVAITFGYCAWIIKKSKRKPGYDVKKCVLAIDLLGRGTLAEAAKRFKAAHKETQDIDLLCFEAKADRDGQVKEAEVAKALQAWLNKNVIGKYGYAYALVGGPMAASVAYGGITANVIDQNIFAFKSGQYVSVLTIAKKSSGPGIARTVA